VATSAGTPNFRLTERTGKETALPPQQSVDSPRDGTRWERKREPLLTSKTDNYRWMTCGGCGRTVDTRDWWGFPQLDANPALVHLIPDATAPAYGIHCTCGDYTLYVNPENLPLGLPKGVRTPWTE
jgi:hypothetical protein